MGTEAVSGAVVKETLAGYVFEVEAYLRQCLRDKNIPCLLLTPMQYSLDAGGKKLRPVLCLVFAEMFGLSVERSVPFASGLELIHTYSLIHDDLPAMDNDDLRRGKPSNHKKFGEAKAILAGDGLLTEAFSLMLEPGGDIPAERLVRAAGFVARAAGPSGMVGGQVLDMAYTGVEGKEKGLVGLDELRNMHAMKTGALIRAACVSGAVLAGAGTEDVDRAKEYGAAIGVAFQIVDDILDVVGDQAKLGKPVGSDQDKGKLTYPSLVGLEESAKLAREAVDTALGALEPYTGKQADFLRGLAQYIIDRAN